MPDVKDAWDEVGDAFEALALKIKLHFEESSAATTETVKKAIDLAGESMRMATDAVGSAVADEGVRADVQRVGEAITNAFAKTFEQVSGKVRSSG